MFRKIINIKFNESFKIVKKYYKNLVQFLFNINYEEFEYISNASVNLKTEIASSIKFTFIIIAVGIGFFILWGGFAPLDSAAIAPGFVALSGNHKTIQHLEGGVIDRILVKEGDLVKEGHPLIILNETAAKARLQMIISQLRFEKAIEKRLLAEQSNSISIDYADPILEQNLPEVQKIIKTQNALFKTRVQSIKGKLDILSQKIIQYKEQIKGLEVMHQALEAQSLIIQEQVASMQTLFDKAYAPKTDLLELKKRSLEIEGQLGEIKGNIASVYESVAETQLQMLDLENDHQKEINDQLQKTQSQVADLQEQYQAAEDVLMRTVIKAPQSGVITGLQYHTISGVIPPGAKIMNIIPQNDELIIEAHVMPKDIESIKIGLKAKVQLSAYKNRLVPRVNGEVIYFSADRIENEKNGQIYYIARIRIPQEILNKINYDVKLYPGMPADVFLVKGERTFLQYLLSPITDSFHRAFKEK